MALVFVRISLKVDQGSRSGKGTKARQVINILAGRAGQSKPVRIELFDTGRCCDRQILAIGSVEQTDRVGAAPTKNVSIPTSPIQKMSFPAPPSGRSCPSETAR